MLGQGNSLRLLDEAQEVGRHQHPGPENQDSQHMIGSFPDNRNLAIRGCIVVSKIITPEIFFSKLIRRGVIYYAGNCLPLN